MSSDREAASRTTWLRADAVLMDVDSTLIRFEAIDKLAALCGAEAEVAKLTREAMGGSMTYQEALGRRLALMRPSVKQVEAFGALHVPGEILTPGVEDLVRLLHSRGVSVYLVSGGFRQLIQPLADHLNIPRENIFANVLMFNEEGEFSGFDEAQPTSRTGGKAEVAGFVKKKHKIVVMIGDGATDMEAVPPADTFIGFGGNVVRQMVQDGASWFVHNFQQLIDELAT